MCGGTACAIFVRKDMTKEEFDRYYNPTTLENSKRYLHLLLNAYFEMIHESHEPLVHSAQEAYAQRWLQMFFAKRVAGVHLSRGSGEGAEG